MLRKRPLIAVVDDDTALLDLICDLLADEGYEVVCCQFAHEAQDMLRKHEPDLLILDIRLEEAEAGWTFLELLRLVPATQNIPVLICSADSLFLNSHEEQIRSYSADILPKPFDLDELIQKIKGLLRQPLTEAEA